MVQISHDRIEIGHHIFVTIRTYLTYSFLENFQSLIVLILLIMGNPPIIIEFQCFGHVFHRRSTNSNDFIQVFLRDSKTQQLQTSRFIFRINLQNLPKHRLSLVIHSFGQQILSRQHGYICSFLFLRQHGIKNSHNLRTVTVSSFRAHDQLAHNIQFGLSLYFLI